jgi:formylglycine-generating enzyme
MFSGDHIMIHDRRFSLIILVGIGFLFCGGFVSAADLFVSDAQANCIYKFDPSGTRSTFASGLYSPMGLAFDSSGNLYEADQGSGNIYKFTQNGIRSTFASGMRYPSFLAFDSSGNLFGADQGDGVIYKFTPDGTRSIFVSELHQPRGLAFNNSGYLFEGDLGSGSIYKFSPNGNKSLIASGLSSIGALAFDSIGNLFAADVATNNIYKFTPDGTRSTFANDVYAPFGLAFDTSGNLFESDAGTGNIYQFTPNGTRSTFASGLIDPDGMAFAPVPEPSTLVLLGIGAIGLIACAWRLRRASGLVAVVMFALAAGAGVANADVFNMPSGQTSLEMVPVGIVGNTADTQVMNDGTTGYGSVGYAYSIGKHEVTAGQYTEFLNAVASGGPGPTTDPFGLYNSAMATTAYGSQIVYDSSTHTYTAALPNEPINWVSWGSASRFCNWLQNGQKTYAQSPLTTEYGSYTLNGFMDNARLMTVTRNPGFQYYIPTENEWYKAAYYDPNKGGTGVAGYWLYPTKSDLPPSNVLSATGTNNANYYNNGYTLGGMPPMTTEVGAFANSPSAYGTFDQGGNLWEMNETPVWKDGWGRGCRGGSLYPNGVGPDMVSSYRNGGSPDNMHYLVGFRIASIPEPTTIAMLLSIAAGGWLWRKRG